MFASLSSRGSKRVFPLYPCSALSRQQSNRHFASTVIKPKFKGFICTAAHPKGCALNVEQQIQYIESQNLSSNENHKKPKNVLIIGSSTGYGLASRITSAFGYNASTIGVFFEKAGAGKRTATAGWYNTAAFQECADQRNLYSKNINGDAFSTEILEETIALIKNDFGLNAIDLVIYSLASPRRQCPQTGVVYNSTLKPIGQNIVQTGVDTDKEVMKEFSIEQATEDEIASTIKVMGGEDWKRWMNALAAENCLSADHQTSAFTYIGDRITRDIYWDGTIGAAKKDLDHTVAELNRNGVHASVSVLKAVITQASAAIPVMPLYLSLLFKVMKENQTHEGCIEQIARLFDECLFHDAAESKNPRRQKDEHGRNRVDNKELMPDIQRQVEQLWLQTTSDNLKEISDFDGFKTGFRQLFGFEMDGIDYNQEVDTEVAINHLYDSTATTIAK